MQRLINWFGAMALVIAPFLIDTDLGKILAIAGLTCLTIQALQLRVSNLVVLNSLGIVGYLYALYS
jgi:hypothetical protein